MMLIQYIINIFDYISMIYSDMVSTDRTPFNDKCHLYLLQTHSALADTLRF